MSVARDATPDFSPCAVGHAWAVVQPLFRATRAALRFVPLPSERLKCSHGVYPPWQHWLSLSEPMRRTPPPPLSKHDRQRVWD